VQKPVSRRELYARILRDLATQPVTFYPMVIGLTLLLLSAVAGGPLAFLGFLALVVGAANFLAQLASGKVSRSVVEKLEQELTEHRERELDELQRQLASDGDPRTHALLGDLRQLVTGFHGSAGWLDDVGVRMNFDLQSRVEELFQTSVKWLRRTLELLELQKKVASNEVREQFRQERERIIGDVSKATVKLGSTLAAVQRLGTAADDSQELGGLIRELDEEINIAMTVEQRIRERLGEQHYEVE
jgi:hypothetical protein